MGWESRRSRSYYYRKKRVAGRVRSEYVGPGLLGQYAAALEELERCERLDRREIERRTHRAELAIDRQLTDAESVLATMTRAVLINSGYHQHKGTWRKKRL